MLRRALKSRAARWSISRPSWSALHWRCNLAVRIRIAHLLFDFALWFIRGRVDLGLKSLQQTFQKRFFIQILAVQ